MLERYVPIEDLAVGDIVACEEQYICHKGYYFRRSQGFRVKRINRKSISLAPLEWLDNEWAENDTVRFSKDLDPLFARDNTRIKYTPDEIAEKVKR
jgi:hypothetical protein